MENITHKFNRDEILVIKACKSHFDEALGYDNARAIITCRIYATPKESFHILTNVATGILMKAVKWSTERWVEYLLRITEGAMLDGDSFVKFQRAYVYNLFNQIASLPVAGSSRYHIDLDISSEEWYGVQRAIGKFNDPETRKIW